MTGPRVRLDEGHFDCLARHLSDCILQTDPQGKILYINRTERLRGRADYVGSSLCEWVAEEDRNAIGEALQRAVLTRGDQEIDCRFYWQDQEAAGHPVHIVPLLINGEFDSLLWIVGDLAQGPPAEVGLAESEGRYRALFEKGLEGLLIMDDSACILDANPAACKMLALGREDLLKLAIWDLTPDASQGNAHKLWGDLMGAGEASGEFALLSGGGREITVGYQAVAHFLPGLHFFSIREVTHRSQAEFIEKHMGLEADFAQKYLDRTGLIVGALDREQRVTLINKMACELLGYEERELLGRDWFEACVPAEEREDVSQRLATPINLDDLLQSVVSSISLLLPGAEAVSLWLYDRDRDKMVAKAWAGHSDESIAGLALSTDTSLVGLVYRTRQPRNVGNIRSEPSFVLLGRPALDSVLSVLGVPLLVEDRSIGAIFADNFSRPNAFNERDVNLLQSLAGQAALAIENARLYEMAATELASRERAEQALQESQRQLATLMSNLPGMAYRCRNDSDWTMEFASEGCYALTGYRPEQFTCGTPLSYEELILPEDRQMVTQTIQDGLQNKKPFQAVYRIMTANGAEKWVWEQGQGVCGDETDIVALEGFITDITERKRAEAALERHSHELDHSNRLLTTLSRVAVQLRASLDEDQILHLLKVELAKLDLKCLLGMVDQVQGEIRIAKGSIPKSLARGAGRLAGEGSLGPRIPIDQLPVVQRMLEERAPVFIEQLRAVAIGVYPDTPRPLLNKALEQVGLQEHTPAILLPIYASNRADEILAIWGSELREQDLPIFSIFASQVGAALENNRLQAEMRRRLEEQTALPKASSAIVTSLEYGTVLRRIAEQFSLALDATSSYICSYDAERQISTVEAEYISEAACPAERVSYLGQSYQEDSPRIGTRLLAGLHDLLSIDDPNISSSDLAHLRRYGGKSVLYIPLRAGGEFIGFAEIWETRCRREFTEDEISLGKAIAAQAAVAMQNARLFGQVRAGRKRLQALSNRLVEAQELERRRIARELHDEIGQLLTGLKLTLEMGRQLPPEQARENLVEADHVLEELLAKVRDLSLDLRPAMLDDLGLLPTLLWHCERFASQTGIQVAFEHSSIEGRRFGAELETAAYRIVQEGLTNVARHANVLRASVDISALSDRLQILVEDQGAGFDMDAVLEASSSAGLTGMRERAVALGGRLRIESNPGAGTLLIAELPFSGYLERRTTQRRT